MKISIKTEKILENPVLYVTLNGDLTYDQLSDVQDDLMKFESADFSAMVLDMSEVYFLDSSGAGMLTKVQKTFRRNEKFLILQQMTSRPRRVLSFLHLNKEFMITQSYEETRRILERNLENKKNPPS